MKGFFYKLPANIIHVFSPRNLGWHLLAIVLTFIIVTTGFDWIYLLSVQGPKIHTFLFPAVIIGAFIPILLPLGLLALGKTGKNKKIIVTAWTLGQSAIVGYLVSSLYKMFTGRVQPDLSNFVTDISHNFQLGFWEHGIFWGWPSSHTTIAFAMMISWMVLFPKNKIIRYLAPLYALYIGFGVSIGIHWFSEFIAGAVFGTLIGLVVGKCFKQKL